ncbi:hypothetical protein Noda2021_00400 [Candidatus Dependentiae bacterium Noda2021]|nr:hypothetical protein Noda2021_00400 [Candidatus Dependentiae bacterium Noda2021]
MPSLMQLILSGFILSFSFVVNYVPINILALAAILCLCERVPLMKSAMLSSFIVAISYACIWLLEGMISLCCPATLAHVSAVVENTYLLLYLIVFHAIGYSLVQSYLLFMVARFHSNSYQRWFGLCMSSNIIAVSALLILYYKVL